MKQSNTSTLSLSQEINLMVFIKLQQLFHKTVFQALGTLSLEGLQMKTGLNK